MGILALGINNQGQAVGASDLAGDQTFHGFVWSRETGMQDVGRFPAMWRAAPSRFNDAGGSNRISADKDFNLTAFVRQPGGVLTI